MSSRQDLIGREIKAARTVRRGTIVSDPVRKFFDPAGAESFTWVSDVDIGDDVIMRNVPIKINGSRARGYARLGLPVEIQRNAQGRWQIIGPADRATAQASITELDETTDTTTAAGETGILIIREEFAWYANIGNPGESRWNNGNDGFPKIRILDGDGNEL
jgi:hypothetical protein